MKLFIREMKLFIRQMKGAIREMERFISQILSLIDPPEVFAYTIERAARIGSV